MMYEAREHFATMKELLTNQIVQQAIQFCRINGMDFWVEDPESDL